MDPMLFSDNLFCGSQNAQYDTEEYVIDESNKPYIKNLVKTALKADLFGTKGRTILISDQVF